jgi:hypothetical protein
MMGWDGNGTVSESETRSLLSARSSADRGCAERRSATRNNEHVGQRARGLRGIGRDDGLYHAGKSSWFGSKRMRDMATTGAFE